MTTDSFTNHFDRFTNVNPSFSEFQVYFRNIYNFMNLYGLLVSAYQTIFL
jgi:hypothetical protein